MAQTCPVSPVLATLGAPSERPVSQVWAPGQGAAGRWAEHPLACGYVSDPLSQTEGSRLLLLRPPEPAVGALCVLAGSGQSHFSHCGRCASRPALVCFGYFKDLLILESAQKRGAGQRERERDPLTECGV